MTVLCQYQGGKVDGRSHQRLLIPDILVSVKQLTHHPIKKANRKIKHFHSLSNSESVNL
ncbi:MAG: hypothetical protein QQW96_15715 [Tychonema bourrellyi B0820]|uniref:hypothetical protein n=1 Tax=Tychonema bourrellyi TaxID=54313 RepID=UPI0015D50ED3|nr:hypothetical protein [Tychonema bourrellyi]MDQ2099080.1 hypothetical protein [Tychonema bourrellyi B0820]